MRPSGFPRARRPLIRLALWLGLAAAAGCGSDPPAGKRNIDNTVEEDAGQPPPPPRKPDAAAPDDVEIDGAVAPALDGGALDGGGDATSFPRRPSCTTQPVLKNGDLEEPAAGGAVPGWQLETTGAGSVQWDPISGYAGTAGLSFRVPDDATASGAVARQSVTLEPYTGYTFRARVATGNMRPRGDGFFLFTAVVRNGSRTFTVGPRKQDRTDLDYGSYTTDFATGPDGKVDIELRTAGTGHFLVDGLTLTCSDRAQRYGGPGLVLTVYDNHVQSATPPNIEKVVGTVEKALASYADLTGQTPPAKASAFPAVAAATEARGNPALWADGVTAALWATPGYAPPSLMTALARGFDRPAWLFEDDLAHLLVYHAAETHDLVLGAPETTGRGMMARQTYQQVHDATWRMGGCAIGRGLVYKNILIRDRIGWEPFKKTFRYLDGLPAAQLPATRWERLRLWHDKLAEFSGMDVWATFSPTDRALLEARYNPPALPPLRPLATVPLATLMVPLTTIQWESGTARDRPARNRLPDDCALTTSAGPTEGLWAYPFSQYTYRLGRRWKRLQTGHSLLSGWAGAVVFIVRGDGRELFRSQPVRDTMPRPIDLDVTTVDRLELIVTDGGDGSAQDGAAWVAPRLTR